jgi:hypothetical protein
MIERWSLAKIGHLDVLVVFRWGIDLIGGGGPPRAATDSFYQWISRVLSPRMRALPHKKGMSRHPRRRC